MSRCTRDDEALGSTRGGSFQQWVDGPDAGSQGGRDVTTLQISGERIEVPEAGLPFKRCYGQHAVAIILVHSAKLA